MFERLLIKEEPVKKVHGSRKSMILSPFPRAAKTREGPVDLRSAEQVSDQRTGPVGGKACPVCIGGGLPRRAGEPMQTDTGLKGRFYAPKNFVTGSKKRAGARMDL